MRLIDRLFGRKPARPPASRPARRTQPPREDRRHQLLAMAVRDTLLKHGIPFHWISPETVPALTASRVPGMHLRLVVREWRPELLMYTVALQRAIQVRLIRLDALSTSWLAGVSWRYDVVDDSTCPPLPPPNHWGVSRRVAAQPLPAPLPAPAPRELPAHAAGDFRPTEPMGHG